jgi:nitrite reductase/ring-hydroxylating ferredoxin subunit
MQSRRKFLKNSCLACLAFSSVGVILESCSVPHQMVKPTKLGKDIAVLLSNFEKENLIIVRHSSLAFDILVTKNDQIFTAMEMKCSHEEMPLHVAGKKMMCSAHGSEFSLTGELLKEPALKNLTHLKTEIINEQLIIKL